MLMHNMRYSYCRTCHSAQGTAVEEPMTIYDWNHFYVDREWLWTAIARAKKSDDVFFQVDSIDKKIEEFEIKVMDEYLDHKIKEHSYQDTKNKREMDINSYVF